MIAKSSYKETPDDWVTKYAGCYTKFANDAGSKFIIRLRSFQGPIGGKIQSSVYVIDPKGISTSTMITDPADISFKYPTLGFINLGLTTIFVERNTNLGGSAKYKRLYHPETVIINDISKTERMKSGLNGKDITPDTIAWNIFHNELLSPKAALEAVDSCKKLSVAFHKDYAFRLIDRPYLYHKALNVGRVVDDVIHLHPKAFPLLEEIQEFGFIVKLANGYPNGRLQNNQAGLKIKDRQQININDIIIRDFEDDEDHEGDE